MKIDMVEALEKASQKRTDVAIWEFLDKQNVSYYSMRELTMFITCQSDGFNNIQKIANFAKSLESSNFTIHYIESNRPKINNDGKYFASISNEI